MGSKVDELSGETCVENAPSFSGNDVLPAIKSKKDFAMEPKIEVPKSLEDHDVCLAEKESIDKVVDTVGPDLIASQAHQIEESDNSEIVEVDVKVCDICGDVGREYLLAICSRCTDGAEHTYCMRKMVEKVPEGDWLCEECKLEEKMKNEKHVKSSRVNEKEMTSQSGRATIVNSDHPVKTEPKASDCGEDKAIKKHSYVKTSGKRRADDNEVSSATKKKHLKLLSGSPKAQIPHRVASLSRESSFKNLEKEKVKLVNQVSHGIELSSATKKQALELKGSPKSQIQKKVASLYRESSFKNIEKAKIKLLNSPRYDSGVSSVAKKRALEPTLHSPKEKIPNRIASLSREGSFKNLETGKVKPLNPFSSGSFAANLSSSTGQHLQPTRGIFSKSKSFSSLNTKPKVKLVDQVSPKKQKLVGETAFINSQKGAVRSLGKSMSFKSSNSTPSNDAESKVKMFSLRSPRDCDIKGPKKVKEKSSYEHSLRSERSSCAAISSSRSDKKPSPLGDPSQSMKGTVSKPPGETKKQASHVDGFSAAKRVKSYEEKPNQSSLKGDSSSISHVAVRTVCSDDEVPPDGLSQPKESTKCSQKARERSGGHSRQENTTGRKDVPCQKCKESCHMVQFCTVDGPELPLDASAVKNPGEVTNGSGDVKAAIEAAMLKKPGICWKNKVLDHFEDLSASNQNTDVSSRDQLPSSSFKENIKCSKESHEEPKRLQQSIAGSSRPETKNNAEQLIVLPAEAPIRTGDAGPRVPSDGKSSIINVQSHSPVEKAFLGTAIPEHQYIWQGGFEIHRSGKILRLCDGIQAHLSICASPKVSDVANRFPQKLVLNEVSRLSYWPIQFQEYGVREDNIALFFFPVDIESYETSYKILLGGMMKRDLALKGNIGGIELLIFPSNQLPEKFHRWNTMFFLWGAFKGNMENYLHVIGAEKLLTQNIPRTILPLPDNLCDLGPIKNAACGSTAIDTEMPASDEPESVSSYKMVNGKFGPQGSPQEVGNASNSRVEAEQFCVPIGGVKNPGQLSVQCAAQVYRHRPLLYSREAPAAAQEVVYVRRSLKKPSAEDALELGHIPLGDGSTKQETTLAPAPSMNLISSCGVNIKINSHSVETLLQSTASGTSHWIPNHIPDNFVSVYHNIKEESSINEFCGYNDQTGHLSHGLLSGMHPAAASGLSPQERACDEHEALSESAMLGHSGRAETFFFPVAPLDSGFNGSTMQCKVEKDVLHDKAPNLELALVTETESATPEVPLFLGGNVGKKQESPDYAAMEEEVSTSLSLSFPYPDGKQGGSSSKTEQIASGRRHVNTTLFLF